MSWNTSVNKFDLLQIYEQWLDLLEHLVARCGVEWPNMEIRPHVDADQVLLRWKYGELGRVYLDHERVCFSSTARTKLKELDADIPDLEFHEELLPMRNWQIDERIRSDIEYRFRYFWLTALEEAQLYWDGMRSVSSKLDEIGPEGST